MMPFIVTFTFKIMAMGNAFIGNYSNCFAAIGTLTVSYVALRLLYSIWKGVKVFLLARMFALGVNLKKTGSWAVVTGSTDGIGKAYAEQLAKVGLNIVLVSRSAEKLAATANEIENRYKVKTLTVAIDFSDGGAIYDTIRRALADLEIGVLVNNVGMGYEYPEFFLNLTDKTVHDLISINVLAVTMMTKLVLPSMEQRRKGVVINVSSSSGDFPTPLLTVYSATKAYTDFFSRALQFEYRAKGILIQSVMPHFVSTKLSKIRHVSVAVPTPRTYVSAALATVGVEQRTFGCAVHALQNWVHRLLPDAVYEKLCFSVLNGTRRRAIKKRQQKTD